MDPVKQLMDEHRVIERVVDIFDKLIEGLENGIKVSPELIMTNIGMLAECANEYHCGKEMNIILPYLDSMGKTDLKTALESYLNDYNNSFGYIDNILAVMEAYASGDMSVAAKIVENGLTFIEEVRPIFEGEDEAVFKILKQGLDKEELAQLGEMIQEFEYSWNGPLLMNYQKMVREMERKTGQIIW
ncbi:MAG: hypothetical protein SCH39_12350 [Methanosarcinales archaeon]|nr:hypothetical protein [ANME-2 cluster archaeon]MDF1532524.1 hypothetical protein [ANME-2 cluster archaeon]MDW7777106.1 hypothetical protein [Methanosarcinales archaeon]